MIGTNKKPEVCEVTCFSTQAFQVSKKDMLNIRIEGAGFLRVGPTDKDPLNAADFLKVEK